MTSYERKIRKIMTTEKCGRAKAERFYQLSEMLSSDDFNAEIGKQIYAELESLRASGE